MDDEVRESTESISDRATRLWREADEPKKERMLSGITGPKPHLRKLTEDQVRMIRTSDKSILALSRELGVTALTVQRVRDRTTYRDVE